MELHHVSCQEAVRLLETDGARGLSRAQAAQRQANLVGQLVKYGYLTDEEAAAITP